jgi:hypothetical protein
MNLQPLDQYLPLTDLAAQTHSSEKKNIFKLILIGIKAKKTSNHRINFNAQLKRLISDWCFSTSLVGKTFVQN